MSVSLPVRPLSIIASFRPTFVPEETRSSVLQGAFYQLGSRGSPWRRLVREREEEEER
jgi:hypothetical protein